MVFIVAIFIEYLAWSAPEPLAVYREQAREVMKVVSCGGCHTPGLKTTKNKALKVYNLALPYWSATMTDRQLGIFASRIRNQMSAEELKEMGIDPNPPLLTRAQIQIVNNFVERELRSRRADPMARFRQLQQTQFPEFYKVFSTGI